MTSTDLLAAEFELHRERLRGLAHRLLGSAAEAEDAVQEAWLRLVRSGAAGIDDLGRWLTTVVARVCLDVLRSGRRRREEPLEPQQEVRSGAADDPLDEALLAESVGLALLVVLERLSPEERVAFVLHDVFAVPFAEIAPVVQRTPVAAKKLASRARQRIRGTPPRPDGDVRRQRRVLEAFLAAARGGDVAALLGVLAPEVVRHADVHALPAGAPLLLQGAEAVAEETRGNRDRARWARVVLVDGAVGAVVAPRGRLRVVLQPTIAGDQITRLDVIADPARLASLDIRLLQA